MLNNLSPLQWYDKDSSLLESEKREMNIVYPDFELIQHPEGFLYWQGIIEVGVLSNTKWELMAVYSPNYPNIEYGECVRVYLIGPSSLIDELEWQPKYLCQDSNGLKYISISEVLGTRFSAIGIASAVSHLSLAIKWLIAFELVLNGDLSEEEFNNDGVI